jgi:hypothetical protein
MLTSFVGRKCQTDHNGDLCHQRTEHCRRDLVMMASMVHLRGSIPMVLLGDTFEEPSQSELPQK